MRLFVFLCFIAEISAANEIFLRTNRHISINLYKDLQEINNSSFVVCPESLQIILSLIDVGARGKTAEQLTEALLLPNSTDELTADVEEVMKKPRKLQVFDIVNKLYVHKKFEIDPAFKDIAKDFFNSDVESIDFNDSEQTANEVNRWVSNKTNDNIQNLITKHDVSETTLALIINTIYLEALWSDRFTKVKPEEFYTNKEEQITVDMMEMEKYLLYCESDELEAKFLKLPYHKGEASMIVVLPNDVDGLSTLEANIDNALRVPNFQSSKVHVKLPKFEISNSIQLIPTLQKWGVTDLFTPQADLSGIVTDPVGFYINKVLQKNYIRVHENGTSVASATVAKPKLGAKQGVFEIKEFIANHPFVYYITSQNGIVFLGRFTGN